jgi:type IV pilus assembly protein PilV
MYFMMLENGLMKKINRKSQHGMSLIEVLIALLIFAFGLLASAGLQLASLKASQHSAQSVVASGFAREYAEIMQMIPASVTSTSVVGTSAFFIDTSVASTATTADACTGATAACNANSLIASSISDWTSRMQVQLPGGRSVVCRDSSPRDSSGQLEWAGCDDIGQMVLVKIGWRSKNLSTGDATNSSQDWQTNDRPRFAVSLLGNLYDYVSAP